MSLLIVSNAADATTDYLCERLSAADRPFLRLNTEDTARRVDVRAAEFGLSMALDGAVVAPEDIRVVWYRRPARVVVDDVEEPGARAFAEGEWTAALEGFLWSIPEVRWINHPSRIMAASSKLEQMARARSHGLLVPPSVCTTNRQTAITFLRGHPEGVVSKPLYSGYLQRGHSAADTLIYTNAVTEADLRSALPHLGAPTIFQRSLAGATDVRVTIIDDHVVAVALRRRDDRVDIRRDNMEGVEYEALAMPHVVRDLLLALTRSYGLRFAAVDFMVTSESDWNFLEINPNGQWAWLDIVGGLEIYRGFLAAFDQA